MTRIDEIRARFQKYRQVSAPDIACLLSGLDKAMKVVEAARDVLVVCGSTGDGLEDFEEQAEAFQRDTGMMRPGKDVPTVATYMRATNEEYRAWWRGKITKLKTALAAAALEEQAKEVERPQEIIEDAAGPDFFEGVVEAAAITAQEVREFKDPCTEAVLDEREACAKVAEESRMWEGIYLEREQIAAAIRARGDSGE